MADDRPISERAREGVRRIRRAQNEDEIQDILRELALPQVDPDTGDIIFQEYKEKVIRQIRRLIPRNRR